jgi:hypothetical protein
MNTTVLRKKTYHAQNRTGNRSAGTKLIGLLALSMMLNLPGSTYASVLPARHQNQTAVTSSDTVHSIMVSRTQTSRRHKIKLYPDVGQQVLFFSANGQDGKIYQLYVFDVYGKLVSQTSIRNRETTVLTNISEGNYLFEVFSNDERIENGRLTVK